MVLPRYVTSKLSSLTSIHPTSGSCDHMHAVGHGPRVQELHKRMGLGGQDCTCTVYESYTACVHGCVCVYACVRLQVIAFVHRQLEPRHSTPPPPPSPVVGYSYG